MWDWKQVRRLRWQKLQPFVAMAEARLEVEVEAAIRLYSLQVVVILWEV